MSIGPSASLGRPRDQRLQEHHDRGRLAEVVGQVPAGVAGSSPRGGLRLVAEARRRRAATARTGRTPTVAVAELARCARRRSRTTYCCGCTLPPLGACCAARRHVSMSASATGRSLNRRIARVVMIASITVGRRPRARRRRSCHLPSNCGVRRSSNRVDRLGVVARQEARDLERRRQVEAVEQRPLQLLR